MSISRLIGLLIIVGYACKTTEVIFRDSKLVEERIARGHEIQGINILNGDTSYVKAKRSQFGKLETPNFKAIRNFLNGINYSFTGEDQYAIISYYPGRDRCNSNGSATRDDMSRGYLNYTKELEKYPAVFQFNICQSIEGIERYSKDRKWYLDSEGIFIGIFFDYHYPCSSYVVIDGKGNYIMHLGEHIHGQELEELHYLMQKNRTVND